MVLVTYNHSRTTELKSFIWIKFSKVIVADLDLNRTDRIDSKAEQIDLSSLPKLG